MPEELNIRFPINFRELPHSRMLAMMTGDRSLPFVMWYEWASSRSEWRRDTPQLRQLLGLTAELREGLDMDVVSAALTTGFMEQKMRPEGGGFVLKGFWEMNIHLSPLFLSQQQVGQLRSRLHKQFRAAERESRVRLKYAVSRQLVVEETPEMEIAFRFITRINRCAGGDEKDPIEVPTAERVKRITEIVRAHEEDTLATMFEYLLIRKREGKELKDPYVVVENFDEFMEKAMEMRAARR